MFGSFAPYVSVAKRRKLAEKAVAKLVKQGRNITPVKIDGRAISRTFWGKSWCAHLESFSDFSNRLPRGRTYVRNGAVVHLALEQGKIAALVQGSALYDVTITIKKVAQPQWAQIVAACSGRIGSLVELLQGRLSASVMETITDKHAGLFPQPKEIALHCSCPDGASMCKHIAAVLYGVGARLDAEPELLFKLRHVDHLELLDDVSFTAPTTGSSTIELDGQNLSQLFGIDIEALPAVIAPAKKPATTTRKPRVAKRESKPLGKKPPRGSKA